MDYGGYGLRAGSHRLDETWERVERRKSKVRVIRNPEERQDPLDVELPIGFKRLLMRRFDLTRACRIGDLFVIKGSCPLCDEYRKGSICGECPFKRFRRSRQLGCMYWLDQVIARARITSFVPLIDPNFISWRADRVNDYYARQQLMSLRDMVINRGLFIKWI